MSRDHHRDVVVVTTAQPSRLEDFRARRRRYLVTMGVRLVAFVAAVVLYVTVGGSAGLGAAVVATVLPWVAVVAANAAPKRLDDRPSLYVERRRALGERPDDRRAG